MGTGPSHKTSSKWMPDPQTSASTMAFSSQSLSSIGDHDYKTEVHSAYSPRDNYLKKQHHLHSSHSSQRQSKAYKPNENATHLSTGCGGSVQHLHQLGESDGSEAGYADRNYRSLSGAEAGQHGETPCWK